MKGSELVLIVDDDPHIREVIRFALGQAGYETAEAGDGPEALDLTRQLDPDLIVLDVMMPTLDGTDVCQRLRAESKVPILFLSARDDEVDRVLGLELGGDDYVSKPFSPRELTARIKAILRRAGGPSPEPDPTLLRHGRLRIDLARVTVFWDATEVPVTATELGLLRTLMGSVGRVYSRQQLIDGAYQEYTVVSERTVDSHIRSLRRKFNGVGASPIDTVRGMGYRLGPCQ